MHRPVGDCLGCRWLCGGWLGLGFSQRQRVGGLQAGQSTQVRDGAVAIHPSQCAVTRSPAQAMDVELGVCEGPFSAVVLPLDDRNASRLV